MGNAHVQRPVCSPTIRLLDAQRKLEGAALLLKRGHARRVLTVSSLHWLIIERSVAGREGAGIPMHVLKAALSRNHPGTERIR